MYLPVRCGRNILKWDFEGKKRERERENKEQQIKTEIETRLRELKQRQLLRD